MATVNIGNIKFTWKGAYNASTAYAVDDIVSNDGSSYVCILASTGNLPTNTTYWNKMAQGSDLGSLSGLAQGDIVYYNGTDWVRLGAGTSGQALITNGTGANPSWGTISSGTYSLHDFQQYGYNSTVTSSNSTNAYIDIAGGNYLSFTPTSTNDVIQFFGRTTSYSGASSSGGSVYVNYGTSTSLSSSDTPILRAGTHANYTGSGTDMYREFWCNSYLECTSLTASTTYYAELAGMNHNGTVNFNEGIGNSDNPRHYLCMIHYKRN